MSLRSIAFCLTLAAVFAALTTPSKANLFGIKHVEPTPLPSGSWNYTSAPFEPYTGVNFADVTAYAQCRYVAPKQPYEWLFTFKNLTSHRIAFNTGLVQINDGRFAVVAQIYADVEQTSIKPVSLKPHGSASVLETGRYGCPGMEGGVNKHMHYLVLLDDINEDGSLVHNGVFAAYDEEVNAAHREHNAEVGDAMAGGASAGMDLINSTMESQQTLGGGGE